MEMNAKILFLDLDGTLLNDQKEITPGNRRAIGTALSLGRRVVIATGRPLHSALFQARRLGLDGPGCYVIAYNGAVIYDCAAGRELFRRALAMEDLYALFDEAGRRGIHIQTYDRTHVLVEPRCDDGIIRSYCELTRTEFRVIGEVRRDVAQPPCKALMIAEERDPLEGMARWIGEKMAGRVDCFYSSRLFLEAAPAGTNKGVAVRDLCWALKIGVEESVAVGDEANDISMLLAAGLGAAMRNAAPEVKAAAGYVTERDNNHDGVAEVVRRFLLGGEE